MMDNGFDGGGGQHVVALNDEKQMEATAAETFVFMFGENNSPRPARQIQLEKEFLRIEILIIMQ